MCKILTPVCVGRVHEVSMASMHAFSDPCIEKRYVCLGFGVESFGQAAGTYSFVINSPALARMASQPPIQVYEIKLEEDGSPSRAKSVSVTST